ncbi:uncharacterized protein LOC126725542 isoform X2 [Quercus robur]|uniref:uncharacterized protein LOC126725542 isoform X2 n=1 Tax=Quercus robur TaxID=38942 RepID=UPI0021634EE8|nr:uncharacterized protein LOC126725542 isoform X2 [Quercus robur]
MVPILSMIRSYELDLDGKVSIVALVNRLQESALNHLKSVGLLADGFGSTLEMHRRDLIWVAYRLQIEAAESLNGIRMEMTNATFPLLKGVVATTDVVEACKDVNIAVMLGGYPRKDYIKEGYVVYKRTLSEITKIMWDSDNKMDVEVKLEVHYGGAFVWNPSLEYFGGKVEVVYRDADLLGYFEIKAICEELGIDESCRVHYLGPGGNLEQDLRLIEDDQDVEPLWKPNEGGPRDTIILYVESGNALLAVEVPDGAGVGVGAGAGAAIGDAGAGVGGGAGAATGGDGVEEEFDWLNEGLEGEDFADDIFGESSPPHIVPHEPNTIPTTNTPHPNIDTPQPNTDAPGPSNVPPPNIDLDEEWAEPALEDDIASVDSSDDEQGPGNLEFNERTIVVKIAIWIVGSHDFTILPHQND